MSDEEDTGQDDRRILRSARGPISHVSLGPEGDRHLFRQLRERRQQQRRTRAAEASRTLVTEAGATAAMATTAMSTSAQQISQAGSSGAVGSTVAQNVSQSTGIMASQAAVLTPEDVAIQQAALQEAQLQQALGEIKAEKEKIGRRARMQRRGADIEELEMMDLNNMDDDVRVVRRALLSVIEMQEHQSTILQDIQQSLAVLAGRAQAAPSPAGPGAWPVPYPPFSVPRVTGVSPYVAPSTVAIVSLGMPLSGGVTAGSSLQVPVQTVFTQSPLQVAVTMQPAVSQPVQPQGTQPQQLAQQPVSPGSTATCVTGSTARSGARTGTNPVGSKDGHRRSQTFHRGQERRRPQHMVEVQLTSYLRCFSQPLRNQLAKEANINMHNFPSFSKVALDLEAKIGHGKAPNTDGRKKTLPPNWKAKGRLMFVDNDGSTIELDGNFQEGVGSEAGSIDTSEGGVVAAVAQKGKATGRRRRGSRSRSQVDPNASKLAPFKETDQFPSRRSMLPPTMDREVDIDDIVDHRELPVSRPAGRGRPPKPKLQYRVRFRHHTDPKEDRWFTREELMQTAPQVVAQYERSLQKGKRPTIEDLASQRTVEAEEEGMRGQSLYEPHKAPFFSPLAPSNLKILINKNLNADPFHVADWSANTLGMLHERYR
ncbi:hypothetical protein CBR_g41385 [Chara braunii]|uniref:Uncharacterized protein n=1 Tax=Chara braunii TaxID=69332 RepID=A0A388LVN6_CHABU|nr:hypothetical protein CBR_g41385 [Chara braunii]|eukprot:GBG86390.1 hypothetical protein CBR_g41385 [Chara braunii]